ncbi:putative membrane protein YkoI [Mycetocola sp. CAN_C7]|uniref:PepSY domain-containing protein n=1 Tax=Mycetocola sp. CAN_C7 TaxID=2787724 RepID=UPI0018C9A896
MKKKTIWISSAVAAVLVLGGAGVAVASTDAFDGDDTLTGSTLEQASKAALAEVGDGRVTDSEADDDGYEIEVTRENGTDVDVTLNSAFEVVRVDTDNDGTDDRDDDSRDDRDDDADDRNGATATPLTDDEKLSATEAALAEVPGTVTDIDRSDDSDHAWEVDVTRDDGTRAEVELDEKFVVVHVDENGDDDNTDDNNTDDNGTDDNDD